MTHKEFNNRDMAIESRLVSVETKLEEVMTNHLPHLEAKMDKIIWALIGSPFLTAITTALVVKFVTK